MKFAEQRAFRLAGTPYRLVRFVFSQHCSPLPSGSGCRVDGWLASHPRALNSMSKPCQATMFVWPCLSTPRRHRYDHHHHHHHRHRRHHPRPVLVLIAMTIFRTIFIMILPIITTMIIIILITNPIVIVIAILTVIIVIIITTTIITIIAIIVIVIIITMIIITTTATASSTTTTIITIITIIIIIVVIILIAMVIILIVIVIVTVLFLLTAIVVVIITAITIIIVTILLTIITIIISIIIMHAPSTGYQWATWSVAVFRQNRRSQVALGRAGALDSSWIAPRLDIIHVDIKPANLFLRETGRFKPAGMATSCAARRWCARQRIPLQRPWELPLRWRSS